MYIRTHVRMCTYVHGILSQSPSPGPHLHEPSFPNDSPAWGHKGRQVLASEALLDLQDPPCVLLCPKVLINVLSHLINPGAHICGEGRRP